MQTVLKNVKSAEISAYFIWLPCIPGDTKNDASQRALEFSDPRVQNYWDEKRTTGYAWQERLGLASFAWDVYLLFDRSTKWDTPVPLPTFWMHQLPNIEKAPSLDETEFESQLNSMLSKKN